jgi:hypothetical protein
MNEYSPSQFQLSQNYPDPFRRHTIIKYCLLRKTNIRLEVFDLSGRKVRVLEEGIKEPGTYRVELNAKGLKDGIYLYRLSAEGFEETRRFLLLR